MRRWKVDVWCKVGGKEKYIGTGHFWGASAAEVTEAAMERFWDPRLEGKPHFTVMPWSWGPWPV